MSSNPNNLSEFEFYEMIPTPSGDTRKVACGSTWAVDEAEARRKLGLDTPELAHVKCRVTVPARGH